MAGALEDANKPTAPRSLTDAICIQIGQGPNSTPQSLTDAIRTQINQGPNFTQSLKCISSARIYRVPEDLRNLKQSAYAPRFVSVGPLHSHDQHLKNSSLNMTKINCVTSLIYRAVKSREEAKKLLKQCLTKMEECINEAKKYYPQEEAAAALNEEMLLVDGCLILELLYRHYDIVQKKTKGNELLDLGIDSALTYHTVQRDLLLLENQLPFFVLLELFRLTGAKAAAASSVTLVDYVLTFFCDLLNLQIIPDKAKEDGDTFHILHLLQKHYLPVDLPQPKTRCQFIQSATDLDYAGVKFESHKADLKFEPNKAISPFQVKFEDPSGLKRWWFSRASFKIPTLHINDSTELFLRNLIAFEQCCPFIDSYVTSYAFVMDRLINTAKDVDVLQKAGIICNYLGSHKDASDLFNKLCSEVAIEHFYFADTCEQAAEYSSRFWPHAVAHLRRNNFSTPWAYIAFCVAFILFFSSLVAAIRNLREMTK
ncbi:UPF0481 protein At3g47200-like isoform X2 [Diospyros lotus]|uniref:UPF0481 protein At3g47200-like isoform X2 n=1 Tax=Diospyros lotus TaxID=55363 RepID=UPI00224E9C6D|nr:UPF0481 protein At3g47200-like isoform X2 [Diospyros lotus]